MIDEMYLQKSAQYQSGEYVEERNLYKGIFAPEVTVIWQWLAEEISINIGNLIEFGLCVQGIDPDNINYKV